MYPGQAARGGLIFEPVFYRHRNKGRFVMKSPFQNTSYLDTSTVEAEVLDWYEMSQAERFAESQKLWEVFVLLGGDYDPEPDTQSPFHIFET